MIWSRMRCRRLLSASDVSDVLSALKRLPGPDRSRLLADLTPEALNALKYDWTLWARPSQLPPAGDWRTWLLLGGRGGGKTRAAAEWVRAGVTAGRRRSIAIVGPTADTLRRDVVGGRSGILETADPTFKPEYEPSRRRVVWPNGAVAELFSAEEPDRLRGPNLDGAWCDELAAWPEPASVWNMLQLALRVPGPLGDRPAAVVSTTPRPLPLLRTIHDHPTTVVTKLPTDENAANLDESSLAFLHAQHDGTTLGRQELGGELLADLEGALWSRPLIDRHRVGGGKVPDLHRIVVAIDPSGSYGARSDEVGLVVAGADRRDKDQAHFYVLEDLSGRLSPREWAERAVSALDRWRADRIVAEGNFGGAMVEHTIRAVRPGAPVSLVTATRGKVVRAEPVVAFYEQGRVASRRHATGARGPAVHVVAGDEEPRSARRAGVGGDRSVDALRGVCALFAAVQHPQALRLAAGRAGDGGRGCSGAGERV